MPQDNQRSDTQRSENTRGGSTHDERSRSQKRSAVNGQELSFGRMGAGGVMAGLRLQKEMFEVLSSIGREWFARATSEVELASRLPNKLTEAQSVPDALSAYQQWLSEWMNMCGEDSYRIVSDSQRIISASVRCFADAGLAGSAGSS
jgi:hypothetical protein